MKRALTPYPDSFRDDTRRRYVYAVLSRRAEGISIGINLSPSHACNWRCVYCQVEGLTRGASPAVDTPLLADELHAFLAERLHGTPLPAREPSSIENTLRDLAFAGEGEPTAVPNFDAAVACVGAVIEEFGLSGKIPLRLLSNGSLLARPATRLGLERIAALGGEVWLKLDSATRAGSRRINGTPQTPAHSARRIRLAASLCPTWLQRCVFAWDKKMPVVRETQAYLDFLELLVDAGIPLRGVQLYGPSRPIRQAGAKRISPVPPAWAADFAERIRVLGLAVRIHL